jgi:hypothetical protein
MPERGKRGDHDYVARDPDEPGGHLPPPVFTAERAAIHERRRHLKTNSKRDISGLALSGGGIRSASFGLGALQALQASFEKDKIIRGIEEIDYLSTVSGGGYIGCSLTGALQKTGGEFPFTNPENYDDTDSVRHIRDYSNYLIPHGFMDFVTALGIIGRGLVANVLIILPVLLFFVLITLVTHPTVASLAQPRILIWDFGHDGVTPQYFESLPGFWFTVTLLFFNLLFLTIWALYTSLYNGPYRALRGGWVGVSKILFGLTVITAFLELQPFILWKIATLPPSTASTSGSLSAVFAATGTVFALFSKYLGDIVAAAKRATGWTPWIKKILATAALWFAAIIIPVSLWLLYLWLTYLGLGSTYTRGLYLGAFALTGVLAALINPNRTSLFRLYRDRLSKAFLFDPRQRENLDDPNDPHDLQPNEPKLHEIDTDLCPYPIVNAALNIEGSQYANKRGRNADFFIFTPEYLGSDATGYIGMQRIETEEPTLNLGTAMGISGAAVSSNMGSATIKPLCFTLACLNIRLGYWLRNPSFVRETGISWYQRLFDGRSFLLFKEAFSFITEKSPTVYLTDGGHIENLGIYSLMKRRCKLIIAIDAEADPTMSFGSLLILERYARIDLGATIDLPWQTIRDQALEIDKSFGEADMNGSPIPCSSGPHCAAGEIQYGPTEKGILLYVKASLSGDEDDYILDYKRRYRAFPHETTGDQFFDEEQLEVYRALGFHIVKGLLTGDAPFAVVPSDGENEDQARQRILTNILTALRGTDVNPPARSWP